MIDLQYEILTKHKGGITIDYQGNDFNTFIKTFDECEYLQFHKEYFYEISTKNGFSDFFDKFVFNVTFQVINKFEEDDNNDS